MTTSKFPIDWATDSRYHLFPSIPGGISPEVETILMWFKEYDETCQEARTQMIKKIVEHLEKTDLKKR